MLKESQPIPISEKEYRQLSSEPETINVQEITEKSVDQFISKEKLDKIKDILKEEAIAVLIKVLVKVIIGGIIGLGMKEKSDDEIKQNLKTDIVDTLDLNSQDQETRDLIVQAVSQTAFENRKELQDIAPAQFLDKVYKELNSLAKTE